MKRVTATATGDGITHIEAPGCIVNIHVGLTNNAGRPVTAISISCDHYAGEPGWSMPDFDDSRQLAVRVVREATL